MRYRAKLCHDISMYRYIAAALVSSLQLPCFDASNPTSLAQLVSKFAAWKFQESAWVAYDCLYLRHPHHNIHLNRKFRVDLAWQRCFLEQWNAWVNLLQGPNLNPGLKFTLDASELWDCGASCWNKWSQYPCDTTAQLLSAHSSERDVKMWSVWINIYVQDRQPVM